MHDARKLAMFLKKPTLEALTVGDNGKRRERKVEELLCHRLLGDCP
jgi:hypothetical protein